MNLPTHTHDIWTGGIIGYIGYNLAQLIGLITVEDAVSAFVLGVLSASGGLLVSYIKNWIKNYNKEKY